jgi:hypothetical protein
MKRSKSNKQWQWREAWNNKSGSFDERWATLVFFIDGLCNRLGAYGMSNANLAQAFAEAEEHARKEGGGRC